MFIIKKIKYLFLTFYDFLNLAWFSFVYNAKIKKLKSNQKEIWLFCDRGIDSGDNGFALFKYICTNHKDIDAYFILSKEKKGSEVYKKVAKTGNILHANSKKHKIYFLAANVLASSHVHGAIEPWRNRVLNVMSKNYRNSKIVFLQHGITKDNVSNLIGSEQNINLFICGAKPEYDYVLKNFGFDESVVKYTGFARYDNLHNIQTKKQILLMPTWRQYIECSDSNDFKETEYYKTYQSFINNKRLQSLLQQNDIEFVFYPHFEVQQYLKYFYTKDKNIIIASKDKYDVQTLLKESKLLITDYSSVFFDFAYMQKPSIFYQFDEDKFFREHYKKGYFDYRRDGFGDVAIKEDELIDGIEKIIENNFEMEEKYKRRIKEFFPLHDKKNCERIYSEIVKL